VVQGKTTSHKKTKLQLTQLIACLKTRRVSNARQKNRALSNSPHIKVIEIKYYT
jgi:hypothetical protein